MKNTLGTHVTVTLFGESHGEMIGAVLDGLAPGTPVDTDAIRHDLSLRRPAGDISTSRKEDDDFQIVSGVYNGYTTGTPICIVIPNKDTRSGDYGNMECLARPSHGDYTGELKYHGYQDIRGGGHFSGRLTAALVAVGAICKTALLGLGIEIGTHIAMCGGVYDRPFGDLKEDIRALRDKEFAALSLESEENMKAVILSAKGDGDSVGGILESAVIGVPGGLGEPWFDSVESLLSHGLYSIPGVKGVEFGDGFAISVLRGSEANDPLRCLGGEVVTATNRAGGINGGITNGMPLMYRVAVRPTPTIGKAQNTVNYKTKENATLTAGGRHDPCIVHRVRAVVDAVSAIVLADIIAGRYGTDYLRGK